MLSSYRGSRQNWTGSNFERLGGMVLKKIESTDCASAERNEK